jgi:hypothetical protein
MMPSLLKIFDHDSFLHPGWLAGLSGALGQAAKGQAAQGELHVKGDYMVVFVAFQVAGTYTPCQPLVLMALLSRQVITAGPLCCDYIQQHQYV